MKSSAPAPKPLPSDPAKARAGSPWVRQARVGCVRSRQCVPATATPNLPFATAGLIPRPAPAKLSKIPVDNSFECTGNAATHKAEQPPRAHFPIPPSARTRAAGAAPSSAPPGNYQFALLCEIQSLFACHFLRGAELCAARTGVAVSFVERGLDRFLGEDTKYARARLILKRVLHQAIFERVITEHHPTSSGS